VCGVEEVLLTELRESRLGVAIYITDQLQRSCLGHVHELGEVELIERWWSRSLCANLGVATSLLPRLHGGGDAMAVLLRPPPDRALTRPAKNSHPRQKKTNPYAKGPYLARQLSDCFAPAITCNVIA
jgi:hypothetical protein